MSYFSNGEDQSLGSPLGCGKECSCGPCRSGMSGFDEWYEKQEADDPPTPVMPSPPLPLQPAPSAKPQARSGKPAGPGLGYYGTVGQAPVAPQSAHVTEQRIVHDAASRGIRNPRQLSNIIFFRRHPNRRGSPLQAHEAGLIEEWRQIRDRLVLPTLRQMAGNQAAPLGRRRVGPARNRMYPRVRR